MADPTYIPGLGAFSSGVTNYQSTGLQFGTMPAFSPTAFAASGATYGIGTSAPTSTGWGAAGGAYDPLAGIKWQQQQAEAAKQSQYATAAATLTAAFNMYGLGALAGIIKGYIMDGKPASEVAILLRQTKAYNERFPAMSVLAKKGKAISEDQYISMEIGYDTILSSAGLKGYFKEPNDYYHYIANNIDATQFATRVNTATNLINNSNTNTLDAFKNYYGINKTDLLKYYLDPEKAAPELVKKAEIATIGGTAASAGIGIGQEFARSIADAGASKNTPEAFAKTAQTREELARLASIGGVNLTTQDIVSANLGMSTSAEKVVTGLASQERARFAGSSAGQGMIQQNVSGSY